LHKTALACAENHTKETGIIEFFCGLYLHYQDELARHFRGDFATVASRNFPNRRSGRMGLIPQAMLEKTAVDGGSCEVEFMYNLRFSDDLLRFLWLSATIANAVGKKPSLKDVVAAISLDRTWMDDLRRVGLEPSHEVADFKSEIETVVSHATAHSNEGWPKENEFKHDGSLQPPFTLDVRTPSGGFQPVRSAKIKLNGTSVAEIAWSEKPIASVQVELHKLN
jgi:hypothetical protein